MWIVYCILSMILCGFTDIIEKKYSKDQPYRYIVYGLFLYNLFNMVIGLITEPSVINSFNIMNCLKVVPFCVLTMFGYYCSVHAFMNSNISVVSPIMRSKIIIVLLCSTFFLNEKLSFIEVILIFLILLLNILLTREKNSEQKKNSLTSILYATGYLVFNGFATFLNKVYVIDFSNPLVISFYTGFMEIIIILLILAITKNTDLLSIKKFKNFKMVLLMEIIEVIAVIPNRYSLIDGNTSIITSIMSCSIIITLITSIAVFQRKNHLEKMDNYYSSNRMYCSTYYSIKTSH